MKKHSQKGRLASQYGCAEADQSGMATDRWVIDRGASPSCRSGTGRGSTMKSARSSKPSQHVTRPGHCRGTSDKNRSSLRKKIREQLANLTKLLRRSVDAVN